MTNSFLSGTNVSIDDIGIAGDLIQGFTLILQYCDLQIKVTLYLQFVYLSAMFSKLTSKKKKCLANYIGLIEQDFTSSDKFDGACHIFHNSALNMLD